MSDRLDVVIVQEGTVAIHHQRWGATALVDLLLDGPEHATALARDFDATEEISDLLAAAVIDHDHHTLILSGRADVVSAAGRRRLEPQDILPVLAPSWPGWTLGYEPEHVIEPVVLYVRGLGLPLASMNEPHVIADHFGRPRYAALTYVQPGSSEPGVVLPRSDPSRPLASFELSVRAENELRNADLVTVGELLRLDRVARIRLGLSDRTLRELAEVLGEDIAPGG